MTDFEPHKEAGVIWLISIVLVLCFGLIGNVIPIVSENLLALVAATFLYLPAWILWNRKKDLDSYGLTTKPIASGLAHFVVVSALIMPVFVIGHHYWQKIIFDNSPDTADHRLNRLSSDLDDRPKFPTEHDGLSIWHESDRLWFLWSGTKETKIKISVTVPEKKDPVRELRGFSLNSESNTLRIAGASNIKITHGGTLNWQPETNMGISFFATELTKIKVIAPNQSVYMGRWAIKTDSPLEMERSSLWWLWLFLIQLILVAIPEEWFYRGYLQQRFDDAWIPQWKIFGTTLGWGWLLSSILFALGHLVLDFRPERLAVFFPSLLFGWLKARTKSIFAPALFHALCNVSIQTLNYIYLG